MRNSKRNQILDAALRVIQREGVTAVTFDRVAAESGLTKGGLLYHFSSKDSFIEAIHQHLAQQWETDLVAALGKKPEDATEDERLAAYARVATRSATGPELLLMLEASTTPELYAPWQKVLDRWTSPGSPESESQLVTRFVSRLAADGLWLHETLGGHPLSPELRMLIAQQIALSLSSEKPSSEALSSEAPPTGTA